MNKKILSRIFYIIAVVSLAIGALSHGLRMYPEDVAKYNIGVAIGIVMISVFVVSLTVGIIMTILARKDKNTKSAGLGYDVEDNSNF